MSHPLTLGLSKSASPKCNFSSVLLQLWIVLCTLISSYLPHPQVKPYKTAFPSRPHSCGQNNPLLYESASRVGISLQLFRMGIGQIINHSLIFYTKYCLFIYNLITLPREGPWQSPLLEDNPWHPLLFLQGWNYFNNYQLIVSLSKLQSTDVASSKYSGFHAPDT
jgi:hypothetical protein